MHFFKEKLILFSAESTNVSPDFPSAMVPSLYLVFLLFSSDFGVRSHLCNRYRSDTLVRYPWTSSIRSPTAVKWWSVFNRLNLLCERNFHSSTIFPSMCSSVRSVMDSAGSPERPSTSSMCLLPDEILWYNIFEILTKIKIRIYQANSEWFFVGNISVEKRIAELNGVHKDRV